MRKTFKYIYKDPEYPEDIVSVLSYNVKTTTE